MTPTLGIGGQPWLVPETTRRKTEKAQMFSVAKNVCVDDGPIRSLNCSPC
jgi:hypothetical protein